MTLSRILISGVLIVLAVIAGVMVSSQSAAQVGGGNSAGRYQISAYGSGTPNGPQYGCYVLDTQTGQVWHTSPGESSKKVIDKLP